MIMSSLIHVLQIVIGGNSFSGVASYLYQQYRFMDHRKVHYDFLFCKENSMALHMDDPVFADSKFFELKATVGKSKSNDYGKIGRGLERVLRENHYDVVVVNTTVVAVNAVCMNIVRRHRNVRFIAHAHNASVIIKHGSVRSQLMPLFAIMDSHYRKKIKRHAAYLFACSEEAGKSTFGEDAVVQRNFRIVRDAIDLESFRFSPKMRSKVRREMGTDDDVKVFGNVGRLCRGKNQRFVIDVFDEIHRRRPKTELWLIGDGEDAKKLKEHADSFSLGSAVRFLGQKGDVQNWLQGMDAFIFPSLSEGLGIVAIEAQAAGLPITISDGVPDDVMLTELIQKVPLSLTAETWARKVLDQVDNSEGRMSVRDTLKDSGYDVRREAKAMEDFYLELKGKR